MLHICLVRNTRRSIVSSSTRSSCGVKIIEKI